MLVKRTSYLSLIFTFFVFMTINMPSIKLIYSSTLVNLAAIGGIWALGLLRLIMNKKSRFNIHQFELTFSIQFILFWATLFWVTWIIGPPMFSVVKLVQYLSVIILTIGVLLFLEKEDCKYIFYWQVLWGSIVSVLELSVGIPKNLELGQNYLTSGVAIAVTLIMVIGYMITKVTPRKMKRILLPIMMLLFLGIISLNGRAPILFSIGIPLIIVAVSLVFESNKVKKNLFLILLPILIAIIIFILVQSLSSYTISRFFRVFTSIEEEPRIAVYIESIRIILSNPFGIGLTGQLEYGLNYPHNIFLEVIMVGGVVTLIPFLLLLSTIFKNMIRSIKTMKQSIVWMFLVLYMFITWNISFDLSSSYMLFVSIAIYVVNSKELTQSNYHEELPLRVKLER